MKLEIDAELLDGIIRSALDAVLQIDSLQKERVNTEAAYIKLAEIHAGMTLFHSDTMLSVRSNITDATSLLLRIDDQQSKIEDLEVALRNEEESRKYWRNRAMELGHREEKERMNAIYNSKDGNNHVDTPKT